jgi:AraC-like DNA-binding protein/mannose-6-phosphate isomerase-like protein (cupin superfamily)
MSRKSQAALARVQVDPSLPGPIDYDLPRPIVTAALDLHAAGKSPPHSHPRGQILYAARGTLTVTAEEGNWVAPPERAIWIPAGVVHVTRHSVGTQLRSVFVRKHAVPGLPTCCAVVQVSPLLRELLLSVMRLPALYEERGADGRLVRVLLDRIAALPDEPLHLPMPASKKLRAIASELAERPGVPLAKTALNAAMSPRSFARHFLAETGLTFGAWQRQARLLRALELLGTGLGVGDVAFTLGYESTSAFIAMFRRIFGTTPARYFAGVK